MVVIHALESVLSIVIMIALGYILTSKGWFDEKVSQLFTKLVVNISLPAMMVSNLMINFDREKLAHSGRGLIIPFVSIGICYILSMLVARLIRVKPERRGVFQNMFFVSNTIFIGMPVNLALFGEKSVPYVLLYYIANTTFFWTIGIYGISKDGGNGRGRLFSMDSVKRIFSPPLLGFIFAIVLILLELQLPTFIMDTCKYVGNLTTPLSLMFIGITFHTIGFRDIKPTVDMAALLLGRFVLSPLTVLLLMKAVPIPPLMAKVFIIQAAMPVMTQTAITAKAYGADYKYATVMITVSTIAFLVFIPIYMVMLSGF